MSTPLRERPDAPLGTLIFRAGLLPAETIESALEEGVKTGKRLGEILTERGLISEVDLARLLAGQKGLDFVILREQIVDPSAAGLFTEEQARLFRALPYALEGELPVVAIADPTDDVLMRNIREALGRDDARFVVSARGELAEISADVYSRPLTPAPSPEPEAPAEPEVVAHGEHTNGSAPADAELIVQAPAYEPPAEPAAPEAAAEPEPAPEPEPQPEPVAAVPEPPVLEAPAVEQPAAPEPVVVPEPVALDPEPEPEPVATFEPQPSFVEEPTPAPLAPQAPEAPAAFEPPAAVEPVSPPQPVMPEPAPTPTPEPVLDVEQPVAPPPPAPEADPEPVTAPAPEASLEPIPFPQPTPAPPAPPYPPAAEAFEAPAEPVPAPVEAPAPVQEPVADAAEWRLTIRLVNGERVEAGDFSDLESAKLEAKTIMTQVADDSGDWPFVNGRFLKPDTIVSVDIAERSGDEA